MFIGHLGAGLALKKLNNKINLFWLFTSVMFLDLLLWIFVMLGVEKVHVPGNYNDLHYLTFTFPYSHGLLASFIWTILAYLFVIVITKKKKVATVLALGLFSHFILDYLVHPNELPLTDNSSKMIVLGLWNNMPVALFTELLLLIVGLIFYFGATKPTQKVGKYAIVVFMSILTIVAFVGQLLSSPPKSSSQLAISSFITIAIVNIISYWIDKKRISKDE
jgi:hypothetical protein